MTSNDDHSSQGPDGRPARRTRESTRDSEATQTGATTGAPGELRAPRAEPVEEQATIANVGPTPVVASPASARPHQVSPAQMIAGRFLVKRTLGEGGMGRVYAVQDKQIEGRDVALKVLLPKYSKNEQFKRLFFQEVRAAQKFVSEYVCQVRDTGEAEEGLFLTMDLVDGESLRSLLDREKVLGVRHALEITRQVLLGLQSGHEKGFIHRDIKPSNVMLVARVPKTDTNPYGVGARLLDFGIAGLAAEIGEKSRAGTVMYMSPEQAGGERLDPRSDLFAVGVLLFEMLSGRRPFEGATTNALVQSVIQTNITERLNEIPNLQKPIRKLLERALQKDREKRFQSAGEFAEAIGKSSAYKIPKEVPAWAWAGLVVLGGAAAVEAVILADNYKRVREMELATASFPGEISRAENKVASEKDRIIADKDSEISAKQESYNQLARDKSNADGELAAARATIGKLNQEIGAQDQGKINEELVRQQVMAATQPLQIQISALQRERDRFEGDVRTLEQQVEDLERAKNELELQAKPAARMAATFDLVLTSIEQGRGDTALTQLDDAVNTHSVFLKDSNDGAGVLKSLALASAGLGEHRDALASNGVPNFEAVSRAEKALASCRRQLPSFREDARAWLTEKLDPASGDRAERVERAVEALGTQLVSVQEASVASHVAAWAPIRGRVALEKPQAVFAHADSFGCSEHLAEAAAQSLAELRSAAESNGSLVLDRLREFRGLDGYVARLDKRAFELDAETETDLRLFELAQRWYDDDMSNDPMTWTGVTLAPLTAPTNDWRYVLQLQWRLEMGSDNFPVRPKRTLIYHQTTPKGLVTWRVDRANDTKFSLKSTEHDNVGRQMSDSRDVAYEFSDHRLQIKGSSTVLVDLLARGTGVSVAPFPKVEGNLAVPPSLASDQDLTRFRTATSAQPLPCLVVRNGQREYWLSPEYGIVADIFDDEWKRALCYATLVP